MRSVYIIRGFLESGKTSFIKMTLEQPYFQTGQMTLLIVCEEGEEEYAEALLEQSNTIQIIVEDESEFTTENLEKLEEYYHPGRVIIEENGMWDCTKIKYPDNWKIEQSIALIEGPAFELFFQNMRSLFVEKLRNAEMILFNRCDGMESKIASYKRSVRMLNQDAEIEFEDSMGIMNAILEEELPFDVSKDEIEISDDHYGLWFVDLLENEERYYGKTVSFLSEIVENSKFKDGYLLAGRAMMTCCAEDVQFFGLPCRVNEKQRDKLKAMISQRKESQVFIHLKARVEFHTSQKSQKTLPFLTLLQFQKTAPPKEELLTL